MLELIHSYLQGVKIALQRIAFPLLLAALIPLLIVAAGKLFLAIPITTMTRDLAAIANVHPLAGFLSTFGILLWWTSASVWLFCALTFSHLGAMASSRFAWVSCLISVYLGLDDLFQFHELLAPTYLGWPESRVYLFLAVTLAVYLVVFRSFVFRSGNPLILVAFGLLGCSVVIDGVLEKWLWRLGDWTYFVEDGFKWSGIVSWTAFALTWPLADLKLRLRQWRQMDSRGETEAALGSHVKSQPASVRTAS